MQGNCRGEPTDQALSTCGAGASSADTLKGVATPPAASTGPMRRRDWSMGRGVETREVPDRARSYTQQRNADRGIYSVDSLLSWSHSLGGRFRRG